MAPRVPTHTTKTEDAPQHHTTHKANFHPCELGLCAADLQQPTQQPKPPNQRHRTHLEVRPQPFAPTSVSWGADLIFFFTVKHNGEFVVAPRSTMPISCHNRTLRWLCCMLPSAPLQNRYIGTSSSNEWTGRVVGLDKIGRSVIMYTVSRKARTLLLLLLLAGCCA